MLKHNLDNDRTYLDSYRADVLETKADEEENHVNKSICDEKKNNKHNIIRSLVTVDNNVNEDEEKLKKRIKNERDIFFDSIVLLHKNNEDKCGCSCQ